MKPLNQCSTVSLKTRISNLQKKIPELSSKEDHYRVQQHKIYGELHEIKQILAERETEEEKQRWLSMRGIKTLELENLRLIGYDQKHLQDKWLIVTIGFKKHSDIAKLQAFMDNTRSKTPKKYKMRLDKN